MSSPRAHPACMVGTLAQDLNNQIERYRYPDISNRESINRIICTGLDPSMSVSLVSRRTVTVTVRLPRRYLLSRWRWRWFNDSSPHPSTASWELGTVWVYLAIFPPRYLWSNATYRCNIKIRQLSRYHRNINKYLPSYHQLPTPNYQLPTTCYLLSTPTDTYLNNLGTIPFSPPYPYPTPLAQNLMNENHVRHNANTALLAYVDPAPTAIRHFRPRIQERRKFRLACLGSRDYVRTSEMGWLRR